MSIFSITKEAEVAGFYYPKHQEKLSSLLNEYFTNAQKNTSISLIDKKPFAIITPNASYKYSGNVAAVAYQALAKFKDAYKRIVVIGSGHKLFFRGAAYYFCDSYETPMGKHKIATDLRQELLLKQLIMNVDPVFKEEHSLEVQLPFIAHLFGLEIPVLPLLFGLQTQYELITKIIEETDDGETLFIISADISDFHAEQNTAEIDQKIISNIISKNYNDLTSEKTSYAGPVKGLLKYSATKNYTVEDVALENANSDDNETNAKIGHAAFVIY